MRSRTLQVISGGQIGWSTEVKTNELTRSLMRMGELITYVLDNICVAVERGSGYRSGHGNNYQRVGKECQPEPREGSFRYSFARVF